MENYGVQPDIFVDNTPEDNLAGRDRQLEVAVSGADEATPSPQKPQRATPLCRHGRRRRRTSSLFLSVWAKSHS